MGQVTLKVQVGPALVQRRNTSVWQELRMDKDIDIQRWAEEASSKKFLQI